MNEAMPCACPWGRSPQHGRAVSIELGGAAELGWMIGSLLSGIDGSRPGPDDFPVTRTELLRFVAFHDWRDRAVMVDLMQDLAFALKYYEKGLHAWPQHLATRMGIFVVHARLHARRARARWQMCDRMPMAVDPSLVPDGAA